MDESDEVGPATKEPARAAVQLRLSSLMAAVAVAAIWLGMLTLPGIGPMVLSVTAWLLGAVAILAAAMGLGWLGFQLSGAIGRLVDWQTRAPEWFHPEPGDDPGPAAEPTRRRTGP